MKEVDLQETQFPNWFTTEFIMGLIGAITGIIGLIIHMFNFRRDKVSLALEEELICQHRITKDKAGSVPATAGTLIRVRVQVGNQGNWSTTVYDVQLSYLDYTSARERLKAGSIKIHAHESQILEHSFFIHGKQIAAPTIECDLTFYHTHGRKTWRIKSNIH